MASRPDALLPKRWSGFDFGLYAFLIVNPLALGLWTFSLAPLIGGNLLVAVVLAGVVMVLGAAVFGALVTSRPWTGGDYAWQTRLLDPRVGAILALTSWCLVVVVLPPIYGNVLVVQVLDPLLVHMGWDDAASWFRSREGMFGASLVAIALAAGFVGLGMRRAAIVQRVVVVIGVATLVTVLGLLVASTPSEFRPTFDERATEIYGAGPIAYGQTLYLGTRDARVADVELRDTFQLVPLVLLFGLWIGLATPLAAEVRASKPRALGAALVRASLASTVVALVLLLALARGVHWEFWNEANNLYWGTVYDTTATALLPAWPNPVVFAAWLTDSTALQIALIAGMGAWVLGWIATLFLAATRVVVAAAADQALPGFAGRVVGDSVPVNALALLVVPACGFAAADAYWDDFASWAAAAVVALGMTAAASGLAGVAAFRRESRGLAVISGLFACVVAVVIAIWVVDPVYGIRSTGPLLFLGALYVLGTIIYATRTSGAGSARTRHLPG